VTEIEKSNDAGRGRIPMRWAGAAVAALALAAVSGAGFAPAEAATGSATARSGTSQNTATPPSIVDAPTLVAHTALGDVGYREIGRGSTILLVTGYLSSMDSWAPSFVDGLAAHHRVVVFDNAGVGETAMPPDLDPAPGPPGRRGLVDGRHDRAGAGRAAPGAGQQSGAGRHPGG
jgi:hypothetical protein